VYVCVRVCVCVGVRVRVRVCASVCVLTSGLCKYGSRYGMVRKCGVQQYSYSFRPNTL
jgi:hypothetical protein